MSESNLSGNFPALIDRVYVSIVNLSIVKTAPNEESSEVIAENLKKAKLLEMTVINEEFKLQELVSQGRKTGKHSKDLTAISKNHLQSETMQRALSLVYETQYGLLGDKVVELSHQSNHEFQKNICHILNDLVSLGMVAENDITDEDYSREGFVTFKAQKGFALDEQGPVYTLFRTLHSEGFDQTKPPMIQRSNTPEEMYMDMGRKQAVMSDIRAAQAKFLPVRRDLGL